MKIFKFLLIFLRAKYFWAFRDQDKLIEHQNKKTKELYKYLSTKRFSGNFIGNELFQKKDLHRNFEKWNAFGFSKEYCIEQAKINEANVKKTKNKSHLSFGLSSGTSGQRGVFISSIDEQITWAAIILAKILPFRYLKQILNPFAGKVRLVLLLRANNGLYESINSFGLMLNYFSLSENFDSLCAKLEMSKPDILVAPASVLSMLARRKKTNLLKINPSLIVSVAEVLENKDEIEKAFHQKVHQLYQCTEGLLGYTCCEGTLHLNEAFVKIEKKWIDDYRFFPIITDFTRRSQFFVNYLHEDILVAKKDLCPCGSAEQALDAIEGRQDEILNFKEGCLFPDAIRKIFFSATANIEDFSVTKSKNQLKIEIAPNAPQVQREIRTEFLALLKENGIRTESFELTFGNYQRGPLNMKVKRILNQSEKIL